MNYFLDHAIADCRLTPDSIDACRLNQHWHPYITRCGYCSVPYTVVGRLETMSEDLYYIGQMSRGVKFKKVESNRSGGGSTSRLAKTLFGQIDRGLVMRLYEFYKADFEMFGYTPDAFLELAKVNKKLI